MTIARDAEGRLRRGAVRLPDRVGTSLSRVPVGLIRVLGLMGLGAAAPGEGGRGRGPPGAFPRESAVFLAVRDRDPEGAFWGEMVDEEVLRAIEGLPAGFRVAAVLSDLEDLPQAVLLPR